MIARARRAVHRMLVPGAPSGAEQWQRVVLNRSVADHLSSLGPSGLRAAEISGEAHAGRGWAGYESLGYPQFDLCAPPPDHATYDVVICEQVLEHVDDPCAAARTLRELTRPGGHLVVSTPFLIRVHELPQYALKDLWRFTPRGLRALLERAGLQVDAVHTWGNRRCIAANLDYWPAYRRWHSLADQPDIPVQVWAFARRPVESAP